MKNPPLISVVMAAYNAGAFIRESIDSILNQSEQNFELLITNDGSSDDTEDIVQSFALNKIRYHANPENLGIAKTRNNAIEMARGKYIAIVDSDDISHPRRLEIQAGFLDNHPQVGVISAKIRSFEGRSPSFRSLPTGKIKVKYSPKQIKSRAVFGDSSVVPNPATMIRANVLAQHHLEYDSNLPIASDFDLYQRLSTVTDMVHLDSELLLYRIHPDNISKNRKINRKYNHKARLEFFKKHFNFDISDIFDCSNQVKDIERFALLNAGVEKIVNALITDPRYDANILRQGAVKYLNRALRGLACRTNDHGAIYSAYRQSELLRHLSVKRKLRYYLKSLLFRRRW